MKADDLKRLCHCGTIADATDTAEKMFVEIAGTDCPIWALQLAVVLRSIALDHIESQTKLTRNQLLEGTNAIVKAARKTRMPLEEIDKLVRERQAKLHG